TKGRLNVIPSGHRTYLEAKAKGENSMFGEKAEHGETVKPWARQARSAGVKAKLPEPQCPFCRMLQLGNDGWTNGNEGRNPSLPQITGGCCEPAEGVTYFLPPLTRSRGRGLRVQPQGHERGT